MQRFEFIFFPSLFVGQFPKLCLATTLVDEDEDYKYFFNGSFSVASSETSTPPPTSEDEDDDKDSRHKERRSKCQMVSCQGCQI
jgi:hypothetical protein